MSNLSQSEVRLFCAAMTDLRGRCAMRALDAVDYVEAIAMYGAPRLAKAAYDALASVAAGTVSPLSLSAAGALLRLRT